MKKILIGLLVFINAVYAQTSLFLPKNKTITKVEETRNPEINTSLQLTQGTPRLLIQKYFQTIERIRKGEKSAYEEAGNLLDLSFIDKTMRPSVGRLTFDRLTATIEKLGKMKVNLIPDYQTGARWYFRKETVEIDQKVFEVEISLDRGSDGVWRFSRETVQSIDHFAESLKDIKLPEHLVNQNLKNRIIDAMPEWTSREVVFIKNGQWLGLAIIFLWGLCLFYITRKLLIFYLRRIWKSDKITQTLSEEDDSTLPFGVLAFSFNWIFAIRFLDLSLDAFSFFMRAGYIMTAISTVWVGLKVVDLFGMHFERIAKETENKFDDVLIPMLKKTAKVVVVSIGAVFVAHSLTFDIGNILAGLGIGGVAIALAAKDTISNLFGSVTVLLDRPFHVGDYIVLEKGVEGTVEDVGFRSTRIRTPYQSLITLPNATLAITHIDNYGAREMRRYKTLLSLDYSTTPEKLDEFCERLRYLIKLNPMIKSDNFHVSVFELTATSIQVQLIVFFLTKEAKIELEEKHKFILEVLKMCKEIGINLSNPTQVELLKNH